MWRSRAGWWVWSRLAVLAVAAGAFWLTYVVAEAWLDGTLAWIDGHLQFALSRDVTEAIRQAGAVSVAASTGGWLLLQGSRWIKVAEAPHTSTSIGNASSHPDSAQRRTIPRQLPPAPQRFAGRSAELAMLTDALDRATQAGMTVVISAIGGAGGIGKTSLSVRWARQHLDRFPDGQLLVDLRGFAPTGEPMSVAEAVRGFLYALGEDPTKLPADLDTQIGLYRSLVEDRRILIVLDNARDTAQVAPLLPGGPGCTVLVTSRRRLAGLVTQHGAQLVDLAPLSESEARQLLASHLGDERLTAEPEAVAMLLTMCGGLPLALSIVAARVIAHPALALSGLADELADQRTRLEGFDAGEIPLNLESVFSWSYQALTGSAAEMFGLLGLAPGPDISLPAVAELAGLPATRARLLLHELETAHLVVQQVAGRYRMHDLLRLYATKQAQEHLSDSNREEALRRVIDFYRHTAHRAERLLDPHRHPVEIDAPAPGSHPLPLADPAEAVAWLEAEHADLMAAQQLAAELGMHDLAWQLAWCLDTFHYRRGHLREWRAVWRTGLESALQVGNPAVVSLAHRLLGDANLNLNDHEEALAQLARSLQVAEDAGDLSAQAHAHRILTWANGRAGRDQAAHRHATEALRLYKELGLQVRESAMLNAVGWFEARVGDYSPAQAHCEAALALCRQHDYRVGEANTLASLGYIAQHTGRLDDALTHYRSALTLFETLNSVFYQANTLDRLGQVHVAAGRAAQAREVWAQAIKLYREKGRPVDADRVQQELDALG